MDPLSISVSCLAVLTAVTDTSRTLLDACRSFRHASRDIQLIIGDLQAFQPVLSSLEAQFHNLADLQLRPDLLVVIQAIKDVLENCNRVMTPLIVKVQSSTANEPRDSMHSKYSKHMKWALFARREAQDLSNVLNTSKSTLQLQLQLYEIFRHNPIAFSDSFSLVFTTIWPSIGTEAVGHSIQQTIAVPAIPSVIVQAPSTSGGSETDGQMSIRSPLIDESLIAIQQTCQSLQNDMTAFRIFWLNEIRDSILGSIRPQTALLTRILQIQNEHSEQLNNLTAMVLTDRSKAGSEDTLTDDVFFDCVSRLAEQEPAEAVEILSRSFSGSAIYFFERGSNFYPEQYSHDLNLQDRVVSQVAAEINDNKHFIEYFFYYATNPRKWQRVHLHATLEEGTDSLMASGAAVLVGDATRNVLPDALRDMMETILQDAELFDSVTSIHFPLLQHPTGELQFDFGAVEIEEDQQEIALAGEIHFIQRIREIGCEQFRESDVATSRWIRWNMFSVQVGSCEYVEHKVRFVRTSRVSENGFHLFVQYLMKAQILSDCDGVTKFSGIVLDDSQCHIKSYLSEPAYFELFDVLDFQKRRKQMISRGLRRLWARQLIEAVHQIHKKGIVIGKFVAKFSKDMNIVLSNFWTHQGCMWNTVGAMPPENRAEPGSAIRIGELSQKGDMFQLGMALWNLSEHRRTDGKHWCDMAGCKTRPYYNCCEAEHKNPIALPFSDRTDPLLREIIASCRMTDPIDRPTAGEVARKFDYKEENSPDIFEEKAALFKACQEFSHLEINTVDCQECYTSCGDDYFHCDICFGGDFDLCPSCVADGLYCCDSQHQMDRMRFDLAGNVVVEPLIVEADIHTIDKI